MRGSGITSLRDLQDFGVLGFYGLGVVGFQVEISRFGDCLVWGSGFYVSESWGSGLERVPGFTAS